MAAKSWVRGQFLRSLEHRSWTLVGLIYFTPLVSSPKILPSYHLLVLSYHTLTKQATTSTQHVRERFPNVARASRPCSERLLFELFFALGRSWGTLGPLLVPLGPFLVALGPLLGSCRSLFGCSWAALGVLLGALGPLLVALGSHMLTLEPLLAALGPFSAPPPALGPTFPCATLLGPKL